tara:strand:- start:2058 stop:2654 length:597 start_codon:yes stop_codon:yes gene_type:complete
MEDIFKNIEYPYEIIKEAGNIIHARFRNECLIFLGEKDSKNTISWANPTKIKHIVLNIYSKNNPFIISSENNYDTIVFMLKMSDNKYSLPIKIINRTEVYPFKPPKVLINDIPFNELLIPIHNNIYFKEVFETVCLCCNNVLNPKKWYVSMGFNNILNDIYDIIQKIIICRELLLCDKIVEKHFGHYVPIREFLSPKS